MDCFKLKPGLGKIYNISEEVFSEVTGEKEPYCVHGAAKVSYYAVCPECENPIQLAGLFKGTIEAGRKPYGRHNKGDIPGLAKYCEEDYLLCSYANPAWKKQYRKRSANSVVGKKTLVIMKSQFDRVIYILSKELCMKISYALARLLLNSYITAEGWLYYNATLNNLPWILLLANSSHPLFGRWILKESELYHALEKECVNVGFVNSEDGKYAKVVSTDDKKFLDIHFHMYNHQKNVTEEHLSESVDFRVYEGNAPNIRTIYKKTIEIDTGYFMNLINMPESRAKRNEQYLNIARELIE